MDPLNEVSMSPRIVRSVTKAMSLNGMEQATKTSASHSSSVDAKLDTVISLLQQLVAK